MEHSPMPIPPMQYRPVPGDLPALSLLSLGSWNSFSRIGFEDCVRLTQRALDLGVNLFDVGFYWDKPHTEVIFGRVLQVVGAPRSSYLLAEKLWLWTYPEQSFEAQLRQSLVRLAADHVDIVMVSRPLEGMDLGAFCAEVTSLIERGLARSWGVTNWEPELIRRALDELDRRGLPRPCLVQLQYNLARRSIVESEGYVTLSAETGLRICAAHTMEGGILAGHLERDRINPSDAATGKVPNERNIARDAGGIREQIRANQPALEAIAARFGATPAQIAIAFTMTNPDVATTLVGVTKITDLEDNLRALSLLRRAAELRAAVEPLAIGGVLHPRLFDPVRHE